MSNYFDNNAGNIKWKVDTSSKGSVKILVDHGNHSHTLDLTKVKIGDLKDTPNKVLGDAHRAASHDKK